MSSLSSDYESSYYTESEAESDYVIHEEGQPQHYNHTLEVEDIIRKHLDITTKNAVGLNHQYKAKLVVLRQQLEGLLLRCQKRLLEIDKSLDDIRLNLTPRSRPSRPRHPGYICGQPFFKDHELYPGPHNEDYLYRKNVKKEFFPLDLFESIETFWTRKDKQMLRESIASQAYEFVRRENQLRDKVCMGSENAMRIIKDRIELKALPLQEIWQKAEAYDGKYGRQKFTVDWLKISTAIMSGRHSPAACEGMWNNFLMPGLKRSMWTPDEESRLVAIVEANKRRNWGLISQNVENRSEYQCFVHYQTNFSELSQVKRIPWTPEEDELLLRLVNENRIGNNIIWNKIVERIPFRNKVQVYHRYKYTLLRPLRGAKFTAEEDCVITAYVQQYGDDFRYFPDDLLPGRTSKQIRARYMNTLRFVNTHVGWSLEEDKRLMSYIAEHLTEEGAQKISWAECSKYLGNHSRLSCRTRYYTIEKFLERHPNATLENVPRREKKKLSSNVTGKNWIKTIVEIKSTPKSAQKPGGAFEVARSSAVECGLYEQMKFSFRYKFGHKLAVDARRNHVFTGTKILLYLLEGFQGSSSVNESFSNGVLHVKDEVLLKAVLQCPLDWPSLVSIMRPKMTLAGDAMLFCRFPPSYNTVLGLRGVCLNASSEHSKQTLLEQKAKKVRSFDTGTYDQAIGVFVERFRKIFHWTMLLMMLNIDDVMLESGEQSCDVVDDNPTISSKKTSEAMIDLQLNTMDNLVIPVRMVEQSNLSYCAGQVACTSGTSLETGNDSRISLVANITIIDPKDLPSVPEYNCRTNVAGQETELKYQQYLSESLVTSPVRIGESEPGSKPSNPNPMSIEVIETQKCSKNTLHSVAAAISFAEHRAVAQIIAPEETPVTVKQHSRQTTDSTKTFHGTQADIKMGAIEEEECPKQLNETSKSLGTFKEIVAHTEGATIQLLEVQLQKMESDERTGCYVDPIKSPAATCCEDIEMVTNHESTNEPIAIESGAGSEKQDLRYVVTTKQTVTSVPYDESCTANNIIDVQTCGKETSVMIAVHKSCGQPADHHITFIERETLRQKFEKNNVQRNPEILSPDILQTVPTGNETVPEVKSNNCSLELLTDVDEPLTAVDIIRMLRSRRNEQQFEDDSDSEQEFSHLPND